MKKQREKEKKQSNFIKISDKVILRKQRTCLQEVLYHRHQHMQDSDQLQFD